MDWKQKLNLNFYYCLIFILSLLVLFIAPMFSAGAEVGVALQLPSTPIGWAIYVTTKLFVACVNLLLFHCFVKQARLNVQSNDKYLAAMALMQKYHPKEYRPRSEKEYFGQLYRKKGVLIFITSILSAVVLTNAVMAFDLTAFTTYSITIIMGVILGIMKMKDVEAYWTGEFYDYAVRHCEHKEEET